MKNFKIDDVMEPLPTGDRTFVVNYDPLSVRLNVERLTQLLRDAKGAHSNYEVMHPDEDHSDWPAWYARYIVDRAIFAAQPAGARCRQ
jgi:hypothetical protein